MTSAEAAKALLAESPPVRYVRAVSPRLRILLYGVFLLFALLGANAVYLASITFLGWYNGLSYEDLFYQYMFLLHLALGLLLIVPFLVFAVLHLLAARRRRNRRAVRIGYVLLAVCIVLLVSGVLLMRVGALEIRNQAARRVFYWLHVVTPLAAVYLYWLHRLAGPRIKWRIGLVYLGAVGAIVASMVVLQAQDPRKWNQQGPAEGVKYFEPSLTRTASGNFIPARVLMNDQYCLKCHADAYEGWFHSAAHHFSSFNNPAYLASVRETRRVVQKRDGTVKASRWCAGCHDPVPFLSGAFDQPDYDDVGDPTAQAGITCTVCHAITHVNSVRGNGDYTIEEPLHYPFAFSDNRVLQYLNNLMVKAKPEFHKKTFLKPFHKQAEFCSVCHKVHLPKEVTNYKEFLRGQNHYDSYLLSGVSGHGSRSFYYPPTAKENCNVCHMPALESNDFGARPLPGLERPGIHSHLFPGANTGVPWMLGYDDAVKAQQEFLKGVMRVDLFGVKEDADIDGQLHAPLRPEVPTLRPGRSYLLETVIRTLTMGHHFTEGTADSNEVWLEVKVTSGGRLLAHSGALDELGEVDKHSHFVNSFVIDRHGNRISRRNAQDIFTAVYNHQIPPGAGQTVHYQLDVPEGLSEPLRVEVRLNFRKFDKQYMDFVADSLTERDLPVRGVAAGRPAANPLPITVLAEDVVEFPVTGASRQPPAQQAPPWPSWQRWNDYGIGMLLKDTAELKHAAHAFQQIDRYDGPLNLARMLLREGRYDEAAEAVSRALQYTDPAPPAWTVAWISGRINLEQGRLPEAQENFLKVLTDSTPEMRRRKFDFGLDYVVINLLGQTLFDRAKQQVEPEQAELRREFLEAAAGQFRRALELDPENLNAHHNLHLIYLHLDQPEKAEHHRKMRERYRPDDNAKEVIERAREKYPAANHAAEALVIYELPPPAGVALKPTP